MEHITIQQNQVGNSFRRPRHLCECVDNKTQSGSIFVILCIDLLHIDVRSNCNTLYTRSGCRDVCLFDTHVVKVQHEILGHHKINGIGSGSVVDGPLNFTLGLPCRRRHAWTVVLLGIRPKVFVRRRPRWRGWDPLRKGWFNLFIHCLILI